MSELDNLKEKLATPVAFFIFKRPDTTEKVFEAIRQAKPMKLLVVADGPREDRIGESQKCSAVRAIIDRIDWDCEVLKNYSDVNLGCKNRVSSGLDWVFNTVEEAIILEDDCLPNSSFFRFCQDLLERYRNDERIMMISGTNYAGEWKSSTQSYHFSYYGGIWGWASWRRAWKNYDVTMELWESQEIKNRIRDVLANEFHYKVREKQFEETFLGKIDTWDYQWSFSRLLQSGLSVVPSRNLVANIGFGEDSTHTSSTSSGVSEMLTYDFNFPIKYNKFTAVDRDYDQKLFERVVLPGGNLWEKVKKKLEKVKKNSI